MPVKKEEKSKIIEKFKIHEGDTGSAEVQIALITDRINSLVEHLKTHKKDQSSRRGLLMLVGQRKRLLRYLEKNDGTNYLKLVESLGLR